MKKLTTLLLSIVILFTFSLSAKAEFFSDIIVTSANGIWTDSRAYTTLKDAIDAVNTPSGVNQRTVVIASPQVVAALTVPSNVTLKFERDGSITNSGQLTINTKNIIADNRQIFTGLGDIDFAPGSVIKTGWFSNIGASLAMTADDTVTLIVSKPGTVNASHPLGNNVTLKWESPGNIITIGVAAANISNIGQIESGNYQILAGTGSFLFKDGSILNLSWFPHFHTALTWIATSSVTLVINSSTAVTDNYTIQSDLNIQINKGGDLTVSPGKTLTLTSANQVDIGPYSFDPFAGAGSVTVTGGLTYTPATTLTASVLNTLQIFSGGISQSKLKTSVGSVSGNIPFGDPAVVYITASLPGGEYGFTLQTKAQSALIDFVGIVDISLSSSYVTPGAGFSNNSGSDDYIAYAQVRYVTASGEVYWIFILREKDTKKIFKVYQAPDHPCFGNGGDPILYPHPFGSYDKSEYEIIVVNPSKSEVKTMQDLKKITRKDLIEIIMENYEIDEESNPQWPSIPVTVDLSDTGNNIKKVIPQPVDILCKRLKEK